MYFFYLFRPFFCVVWFLWISFFCLSSLSFAQKDTFSQTYLLKIQPQKRHELPDQKAWIGFLEKKIEGFDSALVHIRPLFPTAIPQEEIDFIFEITCSPDAEKAVLALKKIPEIAYLEASKTYELLGKSTYLPNDPAVQNAKLWGHRVAKVFEAWSLSKGDSNVIIGIIDSGFDLSHPDLRKQIKYNWKEKYGRPKFDDDGNGYADDSVGYDFGNMDSNPNHENLNGIHGTAMAGISSATPDNSIGTAGTGFNCRFMPIKVHTSNGLLNTAKLCEAIRYAADNGCHIVNMSLGDYVGIFSQCEQDVINYAALQKNVLFVAAAGNYGNGTEIYYPASYQHVLSVTNSNEQDEHIASVRNKYIDLLAPGNNIYTTSPFLNDGYAPDFGGSSSASAFVAGIAGLIKAANPKLTGLQIGEILRQTAYDSIYTKPKNAPYKGLLGKGRVDALKALTQTNTYSAVRTLSARYEDRFGAYAFRDDTIKLWVTLRNYLKPTNGNLTIKISSNSPYISILQNTSLLKSLGTLDSASVQTPFLVYLKPDLPASAKIEFDVRIENTSYQDLDFVQIMTSPEYLSPKLNELHLTIPANGRLGFADENGKIGEGLRYKGEPILAEAGIMIGISPNEVPNMVRINATKKSQDFRYSQNIRYIEKALQEAQLHCSFADTSRTQTTGLVVGQKITARNNTPHHEYLFLDYEIQNTSLRNLDSLWVGFFADWKIGAGLNRADWDEKDRFGYVYYGNMFVGVKAMSEEIGYYAFDKIRLGGNNIIDLETDFTTVRKFEALSKGIAKKQAGYANNGNEVAHLVSAKLRNLRSKSSQKITFIVSAAQSLENLRKNFATAVAYRNPQSSQSPLPIVPILVCNNTPVTIRPTNGTKFRFYAENDLTKPLHEGRFMTVSPADSVKTFYISNADSVRESSLLKYQFKLYKPTARFESADFLNLVDSTKMRFFDRSTKAVAWRWNFSGDTVAVFGKNITYEFKKVGNYQVSLTITDSTGCQDVFQKTIKIAHLAKGFVPAVPVRVVACEKDTVKIRPTNGTKFRFFTNLSPKKAVAEGREFLLTSSDVDSVFVVNLDSALESNPAKIFISRSRFKPNFTTRPTADTLFFSNVQFLLDSASSRFTFTTVEWDFGEGFATVRATNPTYRYRKQGVYTVTMRIFDIQGCRSEVKKLFKVGRKSPFPTIASFGVCENDTAVVSPRNGSKFAFYSSLDPLTKVFEGKTYRFVPKKTQELFIQSLDSIVESDFRKITITVNYPEVDFYFSEPHLRNPRNQVVFQDRSQRAVRWDWDFGDGKKSTERYPIHYYERQGFYTASLSIVDWNGCRAKISKTVKVEAESPVPQLDTVVVVCMDTWNIIAPKNGTNFKFYQYPVLSAPVSQGEKYEIGRLNTNITYYVTCADSMIESRPAIVQYRVQIPNAQFSTNKEVVDLREANTLNLKAQILNYKSYSWDFGNGKKSTLPETQTEYENGGVYTIRLSVTDSFNCQAYSERKITVTPELKPANPNSKIVLYPNPNKGLFNIALEAGLPQKSVFRIYNAIGTTLWEAESVDFAEKKYFWVNLRTLPSGLYLFCAWLDDHLYKIPFVIEQ